MEAYRYGLTSFEMSSWGSVSSCDESVAGAMALSARVCLDGIDFGGKCMMDARAERLV